MHLLRCVHDGGSNERQEQGHQKLFSFLCSFGVILWEIVTGSVPEQGQMHDPKVTFFKL